MGKRRTACVVLGAIGLLVIAGLGTLAYAAPSDSDSSKQRPDVTSVFDPFALTRVAVVPVPPSRPTNPAALMGTRGGNGNNGNGNGKRPPVIPRRSPVRSPCRPLDSR